jgi:hypothetical protein
MGDRREAANPKHSAIAIYIGSTHTKEVEYHIKLSCPCAELSTSWRGTGSGGTASHIPHLATRQRWNISFTLQRLYSHYLSSRSKHGGDEKCLASTGNRTLVVRGITNHSTDSATSPHKNMKNGTKEIKRYTDQSPHLPPWLRKRRALLI